jgi:hypothetical protein
MKKYLLLLAFLFIYQARVQAQVQKIACIVELNASAEISDKHDKSKHGLNIRVFDDCRTLEVKRGRVNVFVSDQHGNPQKIELTKGETITEDMIQEIGINEPPFNSIFTIIKKILAGDPKTSIGEKRAFTSSEYFGLPHDDILRPKASWDITSDLRKFENKSLTIVDVKSKSIIATALADNTDTFHLNGQLFKPGHHYQWYIGKKSAEFSIISNQDYQDIQKQIHEVITTRDITPFMEKLIYASIYSQNDLEFDTDRILSNAM